MSIESSGLAGLLCLAANVAKQRDVDTARDATVPELKHSSFLVESDGASAESGSDDGSGPLSRAAHRVVPVLHSVSDRSSGNDSGIGGSDDHGVDDDDEDYDPCPQPRSRLRRAAGKVGRTWHHTRASTAAPKPSYRRPRDAVTSAPATRKKALQQHNEVEKRRRAHLAARYLELKAAIPEIVDTKISNAMILRAAAEEIRKLEAAERELMEQKLERERLRRELIGKHALLRSILRESNLGPAQRQVAAATEWNTNGADSGAEEPPAVPDTLSPDSGRQSPSLPIGLAQLTAAAGSYEADGCYGPVKPVSHQLLFNAALMMLANSASHVQPLSSSADRPGEWPAYV